MFVYHILKHGKLHRLQLEKSERMFAVCGDGFVDVMFLIARAGSIFYFLSREASFLPG